MMMTLELLKLVRLKHCKGLTSWCISEQYKQRREEKIKFP